MSKTERALRRQRIDGGGPLRFIRRHHLVTHVLLILGAFVMLAPFGWELSVSFKTLTESLEVPPSILPDQLRWENYVAVFEKLPFAQMLANSTVMTIGRVIGQIVFCSMAAYAFARIDFPFRNALFIVFLSVMMVPSELFIIPQYEIVQRLGWLDSLPALIVPRLFNAFGVFLLRQFFMTIPHEVADAARIDGANEWQVFWRIMLPLAKPGIIALAILTTIGSWQDLLWPLIVNTDPDKMPVAAGLATLKGEYNINYPLLMAGSVMAMLPLIILFMILQRRVMEGIAFSGSTR